MGNLHKETQMLFCLVGSDQVHESLVVPARVDPFRWKDGLLCVDEHLQQQQHVAVGSRKSTLGHLKHFLVVEKVVKIPLSDCPGIVVLQKTTRMQDSRKTSQIE